MSIFPDIHAGRFLVWDFWDPGGSGIRRIIHGPMGTCCIDGAVKFCDYHHHHPVGAAVSGPVQGMMASLLLIQGIIEIPDRS